MKHVSVQETFRFIHAADIHLDSQLKGLSKIEEAAAQKISLSTREAFAKMVDLAIDRSIDFIILSGDIFDHESPGRSTKQFFIKQLRKLCDSDIPIYLIWGNHDAKISVFEKNELPKNVHCFGAAQSHSFLLEHLQVAIHGQSYANNAVESNLAAHYPLSVDNWFNIGLLHTSLEGTEGHDSYAPCDLQTLKNKNYDYWALGHIHKRRILCQDPHIVYPGNTQGRHIHEAGEKGCLLVEVDRTHVEKVEFHALDFLRWELLCIDISALTSFEDLVQAAKQRIEDMRKEHRERHLIVRLHIEGTSELHWKLHADTTLLKARLEDAYWEEEMVWVEKIKFFTQPPTHLCARNDGLGDLAAAIEQVTKNSDIRHEIIKKCQEIIDAVPERLRDAESYSHALTSGKTDSFFNEVQNFLAGRLANMEKK